MERKHEKKMPRKYNRQLKKKKKKKEEV